jgi:hypothetical protein
MNWIAVAIALLAVTPGLASAQESPALRKHRVTVNAGAVWMGSYEVGRTTARLRGNGNAPAFTLFTADSRISSSTSPEIKVGFALTPRLSLEGGGVWSGPRIGVAISADAEAPSQDLSGEKLQQYVFDAALNWQLPFTTGRKLAFFAIGGGGYLRQLHEDRTLSESGQIYYTGGGARYWLRGGHEAARAVGLRGDVRLNVRRKGIDFEDKMRTYPTFSLSLFVGL